jgi:hypothetical protein
MDAAFPQKKPTESIVSAFLIDGLFACAMPSRSKPDRMAETP